MKQSEIPSSLRLFGIIIKIPQEYKDDFFYKDISETLGYASLKLRISIRDFKREIIKSIK